MTALLVRQALEVALAAISPTMPTAYENAPFTPTQGTAYQRAYILLADPDDAEMTGRLHWERGLFQINLFYPLDAGASAAVTRAELIRSTFYRGASFTAGAVTVNIRATPSIFPAMTEADRFMVPVRIPFSAQIVRS